MALDPVSLIGIGSSILGIINGNKKKKRNRRLAQAGGELDQQSIALNRQRIQEELRQFTVNRELQGTRDRGNIIARTNASGIVGGISKRLTAINTNDQNREITNRQTAADFQNQSLDIQSERSDLNVQSAINNNQAFSPLEIAGSLLTRPNIEAARSAFGLKPTGN